MSEEHTIAIVSFEGALKREIKRVRNQLKNIDEISDFSLKIEASGRVNDGDVKLTFEVSPSSYGYQAVKGRSLRAAVEEMLRRHGWQKHNDPIAISYEKIPSDDTDATEAPF